MPDGVISVALSVGEENDLSVAIVQAPRGTADEDEEVDSGDDAAEEQAESTDSQDSEASDGD